jgi:hypothetical protein
VANSELALYTEAHVVMGQVNAGGRRISDFLNLTNSSYIDIEHAHWHDLLAENAQLMPADQITVSKGAVQVVVPRDTAQFGAPRVPTQQMRLDMVLTLFTVNGAVHRRSGDPTVLVQFLSGYSRQFLAVSDAHIRYLPNSKYDTHAPLVLVNTQQLRFWAIQKQ